MWENFIFFKELDTVPSTGTWYSTVPGMPGTVGKTSEDFTGLPGLAF